MCWSWLCFCMDFSNSVMHFGYVYATYVLWCDELESGWLSSCRPSIFLSLTTCLLAPSYQAIFVIFCLAAVFLTCYLVLSFGAQKVPLPVFAIPTNPSWRNSRCWTAWQDISLACLQFFYWLNPTWLRLSFADLFFSVWAANWPWISWSSSNFSQHSVHPPWTALSSRFPFK